MAAVRKKRQLAAALLAVGLGIWASIPLLRGPRGLPSSHALAAGGPSDLAEVVERPAPSPAAAEARRRALAGLRQSKSPLAVAALMAANGRACAAIERTGCGMTWGALAEGGPGKSGLVTDIAQLTLSGAEMTVAPVRVSQDAALHPGIDPVWIPKADAVYLFDDSGNLCASFGGEVVSHLGKHVPDQLTVTSLGIADRWFVIVDRYAPNLEPPFEMLSEVYELGVKPRRALRIRHYYADGGFTCKKIEDEYKVDRRPNLFYIGQGGAKSPLSKGVAPDGAEYPCQIEWIAERRRFEGPSRVEWQGSPIFEVVLDESLMFAPLDRPPTSKVRAQK